MAIDIVVPALGESIREGIVTRWLKKPGDFVERDEPLVEIETDKITTEIPAPESGVLSEVLKEDGENVQVGDTIAVLDDKGEAKKKKTANKSAKKNKDSQKEKKTEEEVEEREDEDDENEVDEDEEKPLSPTVRKLVAETGVDPAKISGTGRGGRLTKRDVLSAAKKQKAKKEQKTQESKQQKPKDKKSPQNEEREKTVPMSPLRKRIAERLVQAQQNAAILTTFNEIDMSRVMSLRKQYQERFVKKHEIKLGFMSFFVKASIEALKAFPAINAEIKDTNIVYKNYYDIGVAVGGGKGLVVPIIRDADTLGFAEVEQRLSELATKARNNKLTLSDLTGGTFTISNGGIYGSLLSTPILNPPQSGILGMHKIEERAKVIDGNVVVRPMMYLALSYDHRLVDGREAVQFLIRIKECIEDPERLLLEI